MVGRKKRFKTLIRLKNKLYLFFFITQDAEYLHKEKKDHKHRLHNPFSRSHKHSSRENIDMIDPGFDPAVCSTNYTLKSNGSKHSSLSSKKHHGHHSHSSSRQAQIDPILSQARYFEDSQVARQLNRLDMYNNYDMPMYQTNNNYPNMQAGSAPNSIRYKMNPTNPNIYDRYPYYNRY